MHHSWGPSCFIYFYGIGDRWIVGGLATWFTAGVVAKILKIPVYKRIATIEEVDAGHLAAERRRLNNGNLLQAVLNSVAALLMFLALVR